ETFTTRNGLPSDVVYGIRSDGHGRLWLSTNNGLSCFDPRTGQFTNYGVSDGLQASEFNFGAWYQSPSGELFFGGIYGFNAFMPDRLRRVSQPPAVVLTSVSVGHRPLSGPPDQIERISLGFRDKVMNVEFAALDYTAPERNHFSYKLEGFDREVEYARGLESRVQERTRELSERQHQLERANQELAQASITDSLTGLANRRFLTEYIEKEVALLHRRYHRASEVPLTPEMLDLAFVMIDVDHFKTINDSAGHAAGDRSEERRVGKECRSRWSRSE